MRPTATYQQILEVRPPSEDVGRGILDYVANACPWIPTVPDGARLDRIGLVFSHAPGTVRVQDTQQAIVSAISGGEQLFSAKYRLVLQGLSISEKADPAQTIGQLTVRGSGGRILAILSLSLYRYLCMRALVERSLNAKGVLRKEADLRLVSLTGLEFEERFDEYGDECGRTDVRNRNEKDIADYIRFMNDDFRKHGLNNLIIGTLRRGFRIDTHPTNIRFILPPNNPFIEAPAIRKAYREKAKPLRF